MFGHVNDDARVDDMGVARLLGVFIAALMLLAQISLTSAAQAQVALDDESKAVVDAILTQTGLHLPGGTLDILSFIEKQGANTECDAIDVHWISFPGQKSPLTVSEASQLHLPQSFSLEARRALPQCHRNSYGMWPHEFRFSRLIVAGADQLGEIRSLYLSLDPRWMVAECPELFGGTSTPETRCGNMINPEATINVVIPRDAALTRLVFYFREFKGREQWHLERLGELKLVQPEP
jgi:hypothetical protein